MSKKLSLTVVTSCTGKKATDHPQRLTLKDFQDSERLKLRELELSALKLARQAGEMYTGSQHLRVMCGVSALREHFGNEGVTLWVVSAGYGVIPETKPIVPYNVTFQNMPGPDIRKWADQLLIPHKFRRALDGSPLTVILLSEKYLTAVQPPVNPPRGCRVIFLAKPGLVEKLQAPGVTVVPIGQQDLALYRAAGHVALKGRMFELFAKGLVMRGEDLWRKVCTDDTPESFRAAVDFGAAANP
jgi:hypothetical protein